MKVRPSILSVFAVLAAGILPVGADVEQEEPAPAFADFKSPDGRSVPPFEKLDGGRIGIGKVIVEPARKQVIVPALVNMEEGLIEYVLCLPNGKLHESLLVTDADPFHMSLAMKMLGFKAFENFFPVRDENLEWLPFTPPEPRDFADAYVSLKLKWKDGKVDRESDLSDLVINARTKQPFPADKWLYTNSFFYSGAYQCSLCGNAIAIFADRSSMINYIGDYNEGDNEAGWIVHSKHPLKPGDPVEIVITQPFRSVRESSKPHIQPAP